MNSKKREKYCELERLRTDVLDTTTEIIRQVKKRMQLSQQIGHLKARLNIDIRDEKVEHDVQKSILTLSKELGLDSEFSVKLLDLLLTESINIQQMQQDVSLDTTKDFIEDNTEQNQKQHQRMNSEAITTHLTVFLKAKELESQGKKMIHMEVGEPDYPPPLGVKAALSEVYDLAHYHYTETRGILKLRESISDRINRTGHIPISINADHIIITPGARFGLFNTFASLLKKRDEVICIEPAWPAYKECADLVGAKTRSIMTSLKHRWNPELDQLEKLLNPNTKMIVLNYPNNPTGKILDSSLMNKIINMASDNGLYILSDEVYADYDFNNKFKTVLEHGYNKAVVLCSFSKSYAMTGFRIGYTAATNKEIIGKLVKTQANVLTSVAEPMQYAALAALKKSNENNHNENTPSKNSNIIKKRLANICTRLQKMPLEFAVPDGAMYVYPRLFETLQLDGIALVDRLLDLGLAIAPGSAFGSSYRDFVRLSACQPNHILDKGLNLLEQAVYSR
ncbi:MAG TPA: aminotransferase class I/II-fold pyridoxal phosphate-dependent enzyme [Nitrososphaeraceae archaeon]|jgi:aspartate aminotransferase|nr:aminotransferase class I/II-fold pyridoxal phosphate-dependent enzyme [Nitrososphaeraceae archaeon]